MQDIIDLLLVKGLKEGVDYTLDQQTQALVAVEKTRQLDPEKWIKEGEVDSLEQPLIDDGQGVMIPDESWTYVAETTESYTENIPSLEELAKEIVQTKDVALLVSEYLKNQPSSDSDSLNMAMLWSGGWRMTAPQPTGLQLYNLIQTITAQQVTQGNLNTKIKNGSMVRKVCTTLLDLVAGNNLEKNLTIEQIDQMETDHAPILSALSNNRPDKAKSLIQAITPDGILVTQADKDEYLAAFASFGL